MLLLSYHTRVANTKLQPQYQAWLNLLCRNMVARLKTIPEVVMVAVQPHNESGLPDFFVLLDDMQHATQSTARYRVTQAVLNLRWQYANPWLLDYYFLNLEEYRPENASVSWRDFISEAETIIYVRSDQPFDMRIVRWSGAAAGMLGCAALTLLVTISNRTNPGSILNAGWQITLFLLPLLLVAGLLASACTLRSFMRTSLWSNGEGVSSTWTEALIESGLVVGGTSGLLVALPGMLGFQSDFLGNFGGPGNSIEVRQGLSWQLPSPLNWLAYVNPTTVLFVFSGLVLGLITGFCIAISTGWLLRRWAIAHPLRSDTPLVESTVITVLKYLSLAITFVALFLACYALWPLQSLYSAN